MKIYICGRKLCVLLGRALPGWLDYRLYLAEQFVLCKGTKEQAPSGDDDAYPRLYGRLLRGPFLGIVDVGDDVDVTLIYLFGFRVLAWSVGGGLATITAGFFRVLFYDKLCA